MSISGTKRQMVSPDWVGCSGSSCPRRRSCGQSSASGRGLSGSACPSPSATWVGISYSDPSHPSSESHLWSGSSTMPAMPEVLHTICVAAA